MVLIVVPFVTVPEFLEQPLRRIISAWRRHRRKLLYALVVCLLFFGLLEAAARLGLTLVARHKYGPLFEQFGEIDLAADRDTGWTTPHDQPFRGRDDVPLEKPTGLLRIVTVGDSCVWGALVPSEATFSAKLDALLKENLGDDRVEVLNGGVVGYNTRQAAAHIAKHIAPYHPDLIVYYGTGAESHLWLRETGVSRSPVLERLQPLFFHSKAFLVLAHLLRARHPRPPIRVLTKNDDIADLQQTCETIGARLLLVEYLIVEDGRITSDIDGIGLDLGIPVVRTLASFREVGRPAKDLIFDHEHPTPLGHTLIAGRLRDAILDLESTTY